MTDPSVYSSVDLVIQDWVRSNSFKLLDSFGGSERRYCYMSSANGECFQISIEPPENGMITVNAWDVETLDDRELHEAWAVPVSELPSTLNLALSRVESWMGNSPRISL